MPYEPFKVELVKDGEPRGLSDGLLGLYDINVFLDSFNWIEAPGPYLNPPTSAMTGRRP